MKVVLQRTLIFSDEVWLTSTGLLSVTRRNVIARRILNPQAPPKDWQVRVHTAKLKHAFSVIFMPESVDEAVQMLGEINGAGVVFNDVPYTSPFPNGVVWMNFTYNPSVGAHGTASVMRSYPGDYEIEEKVNEVKVKVRGELRDRSKDLGVMAVDDASHGGAHHEYKIGANVNVFGHVNFQKGPVKECGVNGASHEALLAILIDRLRDFQAGPYACRENALALTKLEEAMHWMHQRTINRMNRGVEGTSNT